MEITGIGFTNTSKFVLTARNEKNSMFYIRPKSDFERELELIKENTEKDKHPFVSSPSEGIKSEKEIIESMDDGIKFYTYNYLNETFTEVMEIDGNIKSKANETDIDNIGKLPLLK
jgi:hypothetical protein